MATIATEGTTTRNGKFTITRMYDTQDKRHPITYRHVTIRANAVELLTRPDQAAMRALARRTVADPKSVGKVETRSRGRRDDDGRISVDLTVMIHDLEKADPTVSTTNDGRTRADFDSLTVTIDGVRRLNNSRDGGPVWLLASVAGARKLRTAPGAQVGYVITPDLVGETVTVYLDEMARVVFLDRVTA